MVVGEVGVMTSVDSSVNSVWGEKLRKVRVMVPEQDLEDIRTLVMIGKYRDVEHFVINAVHKLLTRYRAEPKKIQVETESSC